jgi:DNA (cytosine-5)-methyltransferase 1
MITIGSLFSGIGGFELGLERAIPNSKTIWQCEQNEFCRKVLKKHWPDATIYTDITKMDTQEVPFVDIMCGGFPCQDISLTGKGAGLNGKKSSLWWFMHGCISRLRPSVIVLENVPAITFRGGIDVVGAITELGYDCEWGIIPAGGPKGFGAPHLRKRWFLIGYITHPTRGTSSHRKRRTEEETQRETRECSSITGKFYCGTDTNGNATHPNGIPATQTAKAIMSNRTSGETRDSIGGGAGGNVTTHPNRRPTSEKIQTRREKYVMRNNGNVTHPNGERTQISIERKQSTIEMFGGDDETRGINERRNYWKGFPIESPLCGRNDGISHRVDRLRALGNAIVPQCSEYIGKRILEAGLL